MRSHRTRKPQSGFTLIEAMIAIAILAFGILSLAAVYTQGILSSSLTQYDYIAEKKAEEAIETIFTARDTKVLTWDQINNVGGSSNGVFIPGPQQLLSPGPDGLIGTADDDTNNPDSVITGPGPDNILGTSDDIYVNLNPWMTRTIAFQDVEGEPNLRQVTVTINYQMGTVKRQYVLVSYISSYA